MTSLNDPEDAKADMSEVAGAGHLCEEERAHVEEIGVVLDASLIHGHRKGLHTNCLPPAHLELEIAGDMITAHPERSLATMRKLAAMGVSLTVDAFYPDEQAPRSYARCLSAASKFTGSSFLQP